MNLRTLALCTAGGVLVGATAGFVQRRRRGGLGLGKLGVTARRGPRTGAIEVDEKDVDRVVTRAVEKFTACDDGVRVRPPEDDAALPAVWALEAATGRRRLVNVHLEPRPVGDPGDLVHGRAVAELRRVSMPSGTAEHIKQDVFLRPRPSCQWPATWTNALRSTLTHELAHAADSGRFARLRHSRRGGAPEQEFDTPAKFRAYVNSEVEIVANLAAVAADLTIFNRSDVDMPPGYLLRAYSERWNDLEDNLTPKNRQRFYRLAARMRDEAAQKYAAEDAAGRAGWRKRLLVKHVNRRRKARRRLTA